MFFTVDLNVKLNQNKILDIFFPAKTNNMLSILGESLLLNANNECMLTITQYNYSNYYFIEEYRRTAMTKLFIFLCYIFNGFTVGKL